MMDEKKIYKFLIETLLKKAEGFYYTEEQEDYEKTQNKSTLQSIQQKNISNFDKLDTPKPNNNITNDTIKSLNEKVVAENTLMENKGKYGTFNAEEYLKSTYGEVQ